jgi:predicted RecA/RadA family phage recombinase
MTVKAKADGSVLAYSNTSGSPVAAGDVVVVGNLIGVALDTMAATTGTGALAIQGIYTCPKVADVSDHAIAQGEAVTWIAASSAFDTAATKASENDITTCCIAVAAAETAATTVDVLLNVSPGVITPGTK